MSEEPESKPVPAQEERRKSSTNSQVEKFRQLIESLRKDKILRVALLTHPCPDPDAIACMMGMEWLLKKIVGAECTKFYHGEISHPQNGSMVNLLAVDMKRINEEYTATDWDLHILVDTIPEYAGRGKHDNIKFDVVVDHHRDIPNGNFSGLLIHQKTGACASIVYDMMQELVQEDVWLDDGIDNDTKVATALIAGIMTDTHFLLSEDSTEVDRHAFSQLFEYRNPNFLQQIVFFKRRRFWIDCKAKATVDTSSEIDEEGFAIVGLGLIPERERDLISDMADEMVSWANVETAVAFGVVGGDRIEGSVRSLDASLTVSDFCKRLGGRHGTGGGKQGKGAYQLPLAGFSIDGDEDEADAKEAWESIKKRESKRIRRTLRK